MRFTSKLNQQVADLWERRVLRYLAIGSWNTFFGTAVLAIIHHFFATSLNTASIFTITAVISNTQAYIVQRKFVWRASGAVHREYPKFFLISVINYFAGLGLIVFLVDHEKLPIVPCQLVIAAVLACFTYTVMRLWTFKHRG